MRLFGHSAQLICAARPDAVQAVVVIASAMHEPGGSQIGAVEALGDRLSAVLVLAPKVETKSFRVSAPIWVAAVQKMADGLLPAPMRALVGVPAVKVVGMRLPPPPTARRAPRRRRRSSPG
jgi:hypothetical protein